MFGENSQTFEVMSGRVTALWKELWLGIIVRDSTCLAVQTLALALSTAPWHFWSKLYLGGRIQAEPVITKIHGLHAVMWLHETLCPFSQSSSGHIFFFLLDHSCQRIQTTQGSCEKHVC